MGAISSNNFRSSPSRIVPVDHSAQVLSNRLQALRLILNNKRFAHSFGSFVAEFKKEKLLFIKFYAELEKLKSMCMEMLHKQRHHGVMIRANSSLQTVRDLVLNSSAKIYLLFHSSKTCYKKPIEMHYEGLVAQCLWPLLSDTSSDSLDHDSEHSFLGDCYERLSSCQSSLLVHLLEELSCFVTSPQYFLHYQQTSQHPHQHPLQIAVCEQIMWYAQSESADEFPSHLLPQHCKQPQHMKGEEDEQTVLITLIKT